MSLQFNAVALNGMIELPSSKSLTNRALMIQALCNTSFQLHSPAHSSDVDLLANALVTVKKNPAHKTINLMDAGTPFRFMTAYLAIAENSHFMLTGSERLLERPISNLVDALRALGAEIEYLKRDQYPPILINGKKLKGGNIELNAHLSSQFASALCLVAPTFEHGLVIQLQNKVVSQPYIQMTLGIMKYFGIESEYQNDCIRIPPQSYIAKDITIEKDWSAATFFYCMAMMMENVHIELLGLTEFSLQGDSFISELAQDFGMETTFTESGATVRRINPINPLLNKTYDLTNYPDLAVPMIVLCALQYPLISLSGLSHLELKESKRITALQIELEKLNIHIKYENDLMSFSPFHPSSTKEIIRFESHADHRIVMALTLTTLKGYRIVFNELECLRKSFPNFMDQFIKMSNTKNEMPD